MKILGVVFGVLILLYCIPVADKGDGNMKDFCSIELVRDNKSGSEFLSEVITKVRYVLSLLSLKLLLSSLIILFNSLKIQPWTSVPIAFRGKLRTVSIESS